MAGFLRGRLFGAHLGVGAYLGGAGIVILFFVLLAIL